MTKLALTPDELNLLITLASDQLFRREFIDHRVPGTAPAPTEITLGKALVARMRLIAEQQGNHQESASQGSPSRKPQTPVSAAG